MNSARRSKLSAVDTAWLRMDRPENLMTICGVLVFATRITRTRLTRVLSKRFLAFSRFADVPTQGAGGAYWQRSAGFRLADHVVEVPLPPPAGQAELQALVSSLMATPLRPDRPRWQFHLVPRYGGGCALIVRIHHCYADGIALVRVMLSMTDAGPKGPPAMPFVTTGRDGAPDARDALVNDSEPAPLEDLLQGAMRMGGALVEKGAALWHEPAKAIAFAEQGSALTAEVAKLALMGRDSQTRFKGTAGVAKRVAWAPPLPLAEVKAVGRALGASINDVLLACVAGALRGYLVAHGDGVEGVHVRALVPVNLRPVEEAYRLGNRFGLVFLDLPLAMENPIERLYAVRANMRALRDSYQPMLALGLLAAMGAGPAALQEALLAALSRNATAVMTNVPGPSQTLFLAGAAIDSLMFWVPQSGDIGMGVSIISYAGSVQFGVVTDRGLCPDPGLVAERFGTQFETLLMTALLSPWPADHALDPAVAEWAVQGG